ncbi:ADP-ribosylglycohydrolase family protein [Paenibacillus sp. FSL K6-1230]|uniref:ADP-ribosylglycohydrolase family protein n=1 Tax=Paenibacillus sp. FSL K6-1230 TaxID=2921603 RepID=UPI0030F7E15D
MYMTQYTVNRNRHHGCLFGLAVGDALGTTVEFSSPGTFPPVEDMVGGGVFDLKPGQWTDDTSMALCLGESLVRCGGFDAGDQMRRYVNWYRTGYMSSTGICFDIGNATRTALERFEHTGEAYSGLTDPMTAGNGSIMRLAPVAMAYAHQPVQAIRYAEQSSLTTHGAVESVQACAVLAAMLVSGMQGADKQTMLASTTWRDWLGEKELSPGLQDVIDGSYQHREPPEIKGTGYVIRSLEAALWAFDRTSSFAEGALLAVNLGDDADTTGAVYGQLAGAYYGYDQIPEHWLARLAMKDELQQLTDRLWGMIGQE